MCLYKTTDFPSQLVMDMLNREMDESIETDLSHGSLRVGMISKDSVVLVP